MVWSCGTFWKKLEVSGSFFASLCCKAERKCQMKAKHHTNFQPDRVLSYFQKEWKVLLAVTVSGLIYNIGLLAGPWFEGKMTGCLVDILKGSDQFSDMLVLVLGYVTSYCNWSQTARYIKRFYVRRFANNVNRRMKEILVRQSGKEKPCKSSGRGRGKHYDQGNPGCG